MEQRDSGNSIDGKRVYRNFAIPVVAFDALKDLQRAWKLKTNAEVITRVLLESAARLPTKIGEGHDSPYREFLIPTN